jgi:hypothetical protein
LILLFGSRAVLDEVSFFFMPDMRAQKDFLLAAAVSDRAACFLLTGAFRLPPVALL